MNNQKKSYIAPRAEVLGLGAPSSLMAASGEGPDITDKGDSGDGSDINNAKSAFCFDDDFSDADETTDSLW